MLTCGFGDFFALTGGMPRGHDATMDPHRPLAAIVNADDPGADLEGAVASVVAGGGPVGIALDGELTGVVVPHVWWVQGVLAAGASPLDRDG